MKIGAGGTGENVNELGDPNQPPPQEQQAAAGDQGSGGTTSLDQFLGWGAKNAPTLNPLSFFASPSGGAPAPTPFAAFGASQPMLQLGSTGADVAALQRALGIPADGVYGALTESAVRAYQAQHGLQADGVVGPDTWSALSPVISSQPQAVAPDLFPQTGLGLPQGNTETSWGYPAGNSTISQIPAADWKLAQQAGAAYGVNPLILVAIGLHETGWGKYGAGQQGYTLGYGVTDSGIVGGGKYANLQAQLFGAASLLASDGVHTIQDLLAGKAANYASDPAWERGVGQIYQELVSSNPNAATSVNAGPSGMAPSSMFAPAAAGGVGQPSGSLASQILGYATHFLGTPYVWGGESPSGFDCSGLVQYAYGHFGVQLPRTTYDQIKAGEAVQASQALPGDLVFPDAGHVMIYLGNGMALQAPHTGQSVNIIPYNPDSAIAIRRVLPGGSWAGGVQSGPAGSFYNYQANYPPTFEAALAQWGPGYQQLVQQVPDLKNWLYSVWANQIDLGTAAGQQQAQQLLEGTKFWQSHTQAEISQMLATATNINSAQEKLPQWQQQASQMAYAYGVPLSDQQTQNYASSLMWGRTDLPSMESMLKQQAISRYPGLADQIQKGITPEQFAAPYVSEMARLLEMDPQRINFTSDPYIQKALQFTPQAGQNQGGSQGNGLGGASAMPIYQFQQLIKNDPRWMKTTNARNSMFSAGLAVLNDLGLSNVHANTANYNNVGTSLTGTGF